MSSYLFKKAVFLQFTAPPATAAATNSVLADHPFTSCAPTEQRQIGAVKLPGNDRYADELVPGVYAFAICQEERKVPTDAHKRELQKRIKALDRPVRRKERLQMADELTLELLPRAFPKQKVTVGIIDTHKKLMVLNCSGSDADKVTAFLRKILGTLPVQYVMTQQPPSVSMTEWLQDDTFPVHLEYWGGVKLVGAEKKDSTFNNTDFREEAVQKALEDGQLVKEILLAYNDEVILKVTEALVFKSVNCSEYLDAALENEDLVDEWMEARATLLLQATLLTHAFNRLVESFGGHAEGLMAS